MATTAQRSIKRLRDTGRDVEHDLAEQIEALREEIASISSSVRKYSSGHLYDIGDNAVAVVDQVRHQGAVAARQIGRQANVAGRAVQENPIPVIVALGTIALISALIFTATDR